MAGINFNNSLLNTLKQNPTTRMDPPTTFPEPQPKGGDDVMSSISKIGSSFKGGKGCWDPNAGQIFDSDKLGFPKPIFDGKPQIIH